MTKCGEVLDGGIIAFSAFIISGISGAIILNNAEWLFGLFGTFLGVIIYWSWQFYKWREGKYSLKEKETGG